MATSRAKIRTLIVDDEPLARSSLSLLLRRDSEIEILGESGSGSEALSRIRALKPDLVFLDVQMPECDGFDVLEMLGKDLPPAVLLRPAPSTICSSLSTMLASIEHWTARNNGSCTATIRPGTWNAW
jgi:DNA-binding NarL/FixJ family response regulator